MNFSVHFDDDTVARLNTAVEQLGIPRNRIITRAVQEWLGRNEDHEWPELLREHLRNPAPELETGAPDLKPWLPGS